MADYESLIYEEGDGIATVTLNRPDKHNSFSPTLIDEVQRRVEVAALQRRRAMRDHHRRRRQGVLGGHRLDLRSPAADRRS